MRSGLRSRRWIVAAAMLVVVGGALAALHSYSDPEKLDLDDAVRRATPGQFVRLTDGYTHYEIAGPAAAHVVVLAAGFSVPYYIWDPTFDALVEAGFRVLRYDYYGRGFSDRPDVPYTQDLYVRQLVELLDSLKVSDSIDLAGLSLGGSIVTSFADRFPIACGRSSTWTRRSGRPARCPPPTPRSGASSPPFSPNDNGPTNSWPTSCTPNAFPTGRLAIACRCSTGGFAARGCPNWSAMRLSDQREEIERVGQHPRPVLVIWGKQDPQVPIETSAPLLEAMPRGRLVAVEDAGHLPQWEQPAIVNAAIVEFLREVNGLPGS